MEQDSRQASMSSSTSQGTGVDTPKRISISQAPRSSLRRKPNTWASSSTASYPSNTTFNTYQGKGRTSPLQYRGLQNAHGERHTDKSDPSSRRLSHQEWITQPL